MLRNELMFPKTQSQCDGRAESLSGLEPLTPALKPSCQAPCLWDTLLKAWIFGAQLEETK